MPLDKIPDDQWPFEAWLKLATQTFGLAPKAFWETGFRDWRTLMTQTNKPSMTRTDFDALLQKFPDREIENAR